MDGFVRPSDYSHVENRHGYHSMKDRIMHFREKNDLMIKVVLLAILIIMIFSQSQ